MARKSGATGVRNNEPTAELGFDDELDFGGETLDRRQAGAMTLPGGGGAYRLRPTGHGPDGESVGCFD